MLMPADVAVRAPIQQASTTAIRLDSSAWN